VPCLALGSRSCGSWHLCRSGHDNRSDDKPSCSLFRPFRLSSALLLAGGRATQPRGAVCPPSEGRFGVWTPAPTLRPAGLAHPRGSQLRERHQHQQHCRSLWSTGGPQRQIRPGCGKPQLGRNWTVGVCQLARCIFHFRANHSMGVEWSRPTPGAIATARSSGSTDTRPAIRCGDALASARFDFGSSRPPFPQRLLLHSRRCLRDDLILDGRRYSGSWP
jgi:hypothetical protein